MPGPILHLGATVLCTHAGQAAPTTPFPRVTVSGQPVVTLATPYVVAGCGLTGTPTPPCVTAQWLAGRRTGAGGRHTRRAAVRHLDVHPHRYPTHPAGRPDPGDRLMRESA